ncbi:acetate kinase [Staphylococcus pettenkoferi]|uniref:acetate kinase n=1 Tax=Staphylococcus pettenkoferi TaxID=170573 RepID=UPI000F52E1DA|nr:acetate kinase [Staphylococcus pettenkoferi]MCY1563779.1 acetate kinase [Staphylococcus pettenkoferi]MCY1570828.1 acetate kinase [Staphylococcus pettenkoferi]MCY1589757.1 acetate kinase [Staphylococcus pettenkoferi]MCY1597117.1 acetate kinase [Staphylococcus pettenkoferi]MCY1599845.1 acetate kinase [Staphylococcus pettenkoferi]
MSKLILAINAGSSSLKFQLIEMPEEKLITKGLIERIGLDNSIFKIELNGEKIKETKDIPDHDKAVHIMLDSLKEHDLIKDVNDIDGTGHRVVHGGESFPKSAYITDEVEREIERLSDLAPLHNPANLMGIRAFRKLLPEVPHVAVFDTSFHQSMSQAAYMYSLPYEYYTDYRIRKYGFHGTSHKYVSRRAAKLLDKPIEDLKIVSCHIGNGASVAAVVNGESVDTSMGFTPLAGLTMGTRSGNIDPALVPFIMEKTGKTAAEVRYTLNKESGLLGLTGKFSDVRDIEMDAKNGCERCELGLQVYARHIHGYIGAYAAHMQGADVIIMTAGVGEHSPETRERVLQGLEFMGVKLDKEKNQAMTDGEGLISTDDSPVKVLVVPTNEEVMIARDVVKYGEV